MEQNKTKLVYGVVEVAYFGFFCFEPSLWPDRVPPKETCSIPFTQITAVYVGIILALIMPLRIMLNRDWDRQPSKV